MEAFSTFDTNQNGRLASHTVGSHRRTGYIPLKELTHLMKELGEGLDAATLQEMAAACEPDADGQV